LQYLRGIFSLSCTVEIQIPFRFARFASTPVVNNIYCRIIYQGNCDFFFALCDTVTLTQSDTNRPGDGRLDNTAPLANTIYLPTSYIILLLLLSLLFAGWVSQQSSLISFNVYSRDWYDIVIFVEYYNIYKPPNIVTPIFVRNETFTTIQLETSLVCFYYITAHAQK